jgi:hypothetical protein
MNMSKSPAPRANAGSRANSKIERAHNRPGVNDCEARGAALDLFEPRAGSLACVLAALASLGRAYQ